jgi:hypothetical protein
MPKQTFRACSIVMRDNMIDSSHNEPPEFEHLRNRLLRDVIQGFGIARIL